ncbi:sensor histidine kinase [Pseudonocardia humida]|uniref:histidine kinase n=1 Tax=Pseudonocardia humida TaxID=2800819 RepID=A0ABT1A0N3_9PSEU|nr:sensor histidine kinase [Pseudonocardia humida]MCO1656526.1 sensor histidine kinase [Pseudonocardia humida]
MRSTWDGRSGPLLAADAAAALALGLFAAFRTPVPEPWNWLVAAALAAPLTVRRLRPAAVFAVVAVVAAVAVGTGAAEDAAVPAVGFALYPIALSAGRRAASVAVVAALVAVPGAGLVGAAVPGLRRVAVPAGWESFATTPGSAAAYAVVVITGAWALGRALRARRAARAELAALRARQAVAEERLRIARDVHDAVGHSLGLITMRAAVARHLADSHPEQGRVALEEIERTGRESLAEVRAVLGALRDGPSAPDPLAHLVEQARAAGVVVEVGSTELDGVPADVRTSALRIVREALTNVRRHAGPTRCRLELDADPDGLTLTIVDDGPRPGERPAEGHGLLGMRERAARHGGTLTAGPEPGGGFGVRARLPFTGAGRG